MGQTKKLAKKSKTKRMNRGGALIDYERIKNLIREDPANVNARDKYGNTYLHLVCKKLGVGEGGTIMKYGEHETQNMIEFAKYLIREGADIYAENNKRKTPLDYIMIKYRTYEIFNSDETGELPHHTFRRELRDDLVVTYEDNIKNLEALHTAFNHIEPILGNTPYGPSSLILQFARGGKSMSKKRRKTNKKRK